jgi:hypothetical protein
MPRGDGTGPLGQGSGTGRGAGLCSGRNDPGYFSCFSGRRRGRGRRGTQASAKEGLLDQFTFLQDRLNSIEQKIKDLGVK